MVQAKATQPAAQDQQDQQDPQERGKPPVLQAFLGFHKYEFIVEHPMKMNDLGVPLFQETTI